MLATEMVPQRRAAHEARPTESRPRVQGQGGLGRPEGISRGNESEAALGGPVQSLTEQGARGIGNDFQVGRQVARLPAQFKLTTFLCKPEMPPH
jgi:hypothetical protein